jgi:Helix-turn-helix domain
MTAHVSAAQAARMYGRSEKTVRRWIAAGKLLAQKVDGAYLVSTQDVAQLVGDVSAPLSAPTSAPGTDSMSAQCTDTDVHPDDEDVRPSEPPGTDIMRAEAMAAYTRSLLEPLVAHVAELEGTIRELERENGRQAAELEAARATIATLIAPESPLTASTGAQSSETALGPFSDRWRASIAGAVVVLAIVLVVVLLGRW